MRAAQPTIPVSPLAASRGRILLVDDEPFITGAFSRILREEGFIVDSALDGVTALSMLMHREFDAVVSDILMPGMDGISLLRGIRVRDLELPVLMLTGSPTLDTAIKAVEYGALQYLTKPVDPPALVAALDRAVRIGKLARVRRDAVANLGGSSVQPADLAGLEGRFTSALAHLYMVFQPIVRFSTSSIYGYEALVRSREPALPTPIQILRAAERLNRLPDLGRAIRASVASAIDRAPSTAKILVNLHPLDLLDDDLASEDSPLAPYAKRVIFELTERSSLEDIPRVKERVRRLRERGYSLAVDDIGSGYSGLGSVATLEPELVKLDGIFARGIEKEGVKQHLVQSLVTMCDELGVDVIAEGVETENERDVLVSLGCDLFQGFYYARPEKEFRTQLMQ